ncbi:hypothetical protein LDENG_00249020 [Lucifuga dentata]|nr:hypothetical protein LDENG_00249020 [Lucifuga dentata]
MALPNFQTNCTRSSSFPLQHGTRQGCPLSPLLFTIAIEPLAIWLHGEAGFEGITRIGSVHKLSFYADDLLLYISYPVSSIPVVLWILDQFCKLSGYKLNLQKSEILPVNSPARGLLRSLFPFKWADEGFTYLGIFITKHLSDIFSQSFTPLLKKCLDDLNCWSTLPLSLAGPISIVKMVVLPKFLYLFQHIPIFI